MPELPEVETVVRDLRARGVERLKIADVEVRTPVIVAAPSPTLFREALLHAKINAVWRRGKYIVMELDNDRRLLIHLRMTGKLYLADAAIKPGKHDHLVIRLSDNRQLVYNDTRKFGRLRLVAANCDPFVKLGPEPLEDGFTPAVLRRVLEGRTAKIKPLLLDQSRVAGMGNIYVDEALWQARIHPERRANTLTHAEIKKLHRAIRDVLRRGIENCGTTLGKGQDNFYSVAGRRGRNADALKVFRRHGLPCPACATTIQRSVVAQRGTHFCPACQPKGAS